MEKELTELQDIMLSSLCWASGEKPPGKNWASSTNHKSPSNPEDGLTYGATHKWSRGNVALAATCSSTTTAPRRHDQGENASGSNRSGR